MTFFQKKKVLCNKKLMDNIVNDFLNSLQSHIPSLEDDLEGEEEIFLEQIETVNFMNMGIDA